MRSWSKPAYRQTNLRTESTSSLPHPSRYLPRHERWQTIERMHLHGVPAQVRGWIGLRTSLTAQLAAHAGGPVSVRVLSERCDRFLPSERALLGEARGRVREVRLEVGARRYVLARTVFPLRTAHVAHRALLRLGNRALGSLLFGALRAPARTRQFTRLTPQSSLWRELKANLPAQDEPLWARRALHVLEDQPLLVTEILLPILWRIPDCQDDAATVLPTACGI